MLHLFNDAITNNEDGYSQGKAAQLIDSSPLNTVETKTEISEAIDVGLANTSDINETNQLENNFSVFVADEHHYYWFVCCSLSIYSKIDYVSGGTTPTCKNPETACAVDDRNKAKYKKLKQEAANGGAYDNDISKQRTHVSKKNVSVRAGICLTT